MTERRALVAGCLLLLAGCVALMPRASRAEGRPPASEPELGAWPPRVSRQEQVLSGGVAVLQAPRSLAVRIPESVFVMGSSAIEVIDAVLSCGREPLGQTGEACSQEQFADEAPAHRVRLSSYWIDRTEVTVEQYRRCVKVGRCPRNDLQGAERFSANPAYPVTLVTRSGARDYCRFRGGRLPTEAEWERAARGTAGRIYPWGNLYNSHAANHGRLGVLRHDRSDGFAELAPVGSFAAGRTPEGVLDLAGNVMEWVEDTYAPYPEGPVADPRVASTTALGGGAVARGGSYLEPAAYLRSAQRTAVDPAATAPFLGFRCARSHGRPEVASEVD